MRTFSIDTIFDEAISFVRQWVNLLSESKFEEAFLLLDANPKPDGYCIKKYEELKDVFLEYYSSIEEVVFNNISSMDPKKERINIYKYNDKTGFEIDYDLAINGEWSDFTAQFIFIKHSEMEYYIYLYNVHIM